MIGCCASVLEEFAKSERAKNRSLSVTYCIAGRLADDDSKVTSLLVLEQRHILPLGICAHCGLYSGEITQWREDWLSASVVNHTITIIADPTIQQPGFHLPRHT